MPVHSRVPGMWCVLEKKNKQTNPCVFECKNAPLIGRKSGEVTDLGVKGPLRRKITHDGTLVARGWRNSGSPIHLRGPFMAACFLLLPCLERREQEAGLTFCIISLPILSSTEEAIQFYSR